MSKSDLQFLKIHHFLTINVDIKIEALRYFRAKCSTNMKSLRVFAFWMNCLKQFNYDFKEINDKSSSVKSASLRSLSLFIIQN